MMPIRLRRTVVSSIGGLLTIMLLLPTVLRAQDDVREQILEEERRRELERTQGVDSETGGLYVERDEENILPEPDVVAPGYYDYGGWHRSSVTSFDDIGRDRTYRDNDMRLWAKAGIGSYFDFYYRAQIDWQNYNTGDGYTSDKVRTGPKTDQTYVKFDFGKLAGSTDFETDLSVGRQFMRVGNGVTYNAVHDGARLRGKIRFSTDYTMNFKFLVAKTPFGNSDIDGTKPDASHSRRYFWAVQLGLERFNWGIFYNFKPHIYLLSERDPGREMWKAGTEDVNRDFQYDTHYVGFGGLTELDWEAFESFFGDWANWSVLKNLSFNGEIVAQFGESHGTVSGTGPDKIRAYAFTAETEYFFRDATGTPRMTLAYLFASGDKDRGSVTGTTGGNTSGTRDRAFRGFGYVLTGTVLAPRFSNLHVARAGASFIPISSREWFEHFEIGAQFYAFAKVAKKGAVSDPFAFKDESFIGHEFDVYLNWSLLSDLTASFTFGDFSPGPAYSNREDRLYMSAAVTLSF
ncbi:MAG: alginate export family protein [Planctomycetes bacterium]|nr:alginate export family protein [Planctomycetota bacterium]